METKNICYYGCICFCILSLFEPNLIINIVAGQNGTTTTVVPLALATTTLLTTTSIAAINPTTTTPANNGTTTTTGPATATSTLTTTAGLPTTTAGLPTTTAGLPTTTAGLPTTTAGLTTTTAGLTTTTSRTTTSAAGLPTTASLLTTASLPTTTSLQTTASLPATTGLPTTASVTTTTGLPTTTAETPTTAAAGLIATTASPVSIDDVSPPPTTVIDVGHAAATTTAAIQSEEIHSTAHSAGDHVEEIQATSTSDISVFTTISSAAAVSDSTTEYSNEIDKIIHNKVQELEKSIDEAAKALNELNQTLGNLIECRYKLNHIEADIDEKVFQETTILREVEDKILSLRIIDKELDIKERDLLVLKGQQTLLEKKIDENLKFYNESALAQDVWNVSFFAQRNGTFNQKNIVRPYEINSLNEGRSFNETSGIFTVPFNGIYHFYFTALKMKRQISGTGCATLQIVKNTKLLPTNRKVLAEARIDSADWYGWFPLQLQRTANLQAKDEITVELLEGSIYESGSLDHLLTNFGGFLIGRL